MIVGDDEHVIRWPEWQPRVYSSGGRAGELWLRNRARLMGFLAQGSLDGAGRLSYMPGGGDPGVVLRMTTHGTSYAIAVDESPIAAANLDTICWWVTNAAMRGPSVLHRWVDRPPWCAVYGFSQVPAEADFKRRHREMVAAAHPDAGGSQDRMIALNQAKREAMSFYESRRRRG